VSSNDTAASPAHDAVGPVPPAGPLLGCVTAFDPARGLGAVADDAGVTYGFHATAVADGSRRIDVGTEVAFTVVPGHRGRYEARSLVPVSHQRPA
jgi:cold shock CspA family protein